MKLFKKVTIIGTGLIGGSIALGIKKRGLAGEIVGISRSRRTLSLALKRKAVDLASRSLEAARSSDIVIFAAPPAAILKFTPELSKIVGKDCVVTDAASTKEEIAKKLGRLFDNFCGAHPLAGSEKKGVENSSADIFEGALCVITPDKKTSPLALKKVKALWSGLGSRVALLSPAEHDRILSFVSHLPHIVSFSLIESVPEKYLKFAASGLKDTTRLSASDPGLWADIILSNKTNALKSIDSFEKSLAKIKSAVKKGSSASLAAAFRRAGCKREALS